MATQVLKESSTIFERTGNEIRTAILNRMRRNEEEVNRCLTTIADMLKTRAPNDYESLASQAAALLVAIAGEEHLASSSLVVKANVDRAAYLTKENIDLGCIAANLIGEYYYKIPLEEAKRYGLL